MSKDTKTKKPIRFKREKLSDEDLMRLYKGILLPRMIEEKMLKLLRQGKVSKWFSGIGQEAIAVGATLALQPKELIFPLHRNLGVFTNRDIPLHRLFSQWQGNSGTQPSFFQWTRHNTHTYEKNAPPLYPPCNIKCTDTVFTLLGLAIIFFQDSICPSQVPPGWRQDPFTCQFADY